MEEFLDGEKPTNSEVNPLTEPPKKDDTNPFKLQMNTKEGSYIPSDKYNFDSPLSNKERERVGSYYLSQDPQKLLSKSQSTLEQFANMGGRVITNFVGDTISSIGSTYQIGKDIINEVKNKDAEFTNDLIEFGNGIKDWGKKALPNYRENPNESWDVTDPAWWTEGIESSFSSLSFLVGGLGAVKGVGALAKLTRAEQLLAKAGANVEKLKLGTKIATSATFARNAENMMESFQVRKDVKDNLLKEWDSDPEKFNDIAKSDVGAELAAEGREVNPENLSNFISGKAGWKTYAINSLNIAFDALQIAPIFKGFNPNTSISKFATSSKVLEANRKLLNQGARSASKLEKVFDVLNPSISAIGRSASEGVEEAINYIGTEEGKNLADQLTNKDNSSFTNRLSKYLKSGDLYESAFWGVAGGALFEGGTKLTNKAINLSKGIQSNTTSDLRIAEINNRLSIIEEGSKKIKEVTDNENLDDNSKRSLINNVKAELSLDLGLRAAQAGNIDLLKDQISSKEYKDKLIDSGIANELDVDKTIAKTLTDVSLAEKLYKQHYNSFQTAEGSEFVKNNLMNKSIITDFYIQKNEERKNDLNNELADLKSNDQFIKNSDNKSLESLLYLKSLEIAKGSINQYITNAKKAEDQLLTTKGIAELEKIDKRINDLKEQTKDDTLDISEVNPDILAKQAEIILMEGVNNIQSAKIAEYRKPETIKKADEELKKNEEEFDEEVFNNFKDEINKGIEDNTVNSDSINKLIEDTKKDKKKQKFLKDIQKEVLAKEDAAKRKTETEEVLNNPVVNVADEFEGLPQFNIEELQSPVSALWKDGLDERVDTRNIDELKALLINNNDLLGSNPNEIQYIKNRIQTIRNENNKVADIQQLNTSLPENEKFDFEFNEDNQVDNNTKRVTLEDLGKEPTGLPNEEDIEGLKFLSKSISTGSIRTYLPIFGYGLANSSKIQNYYKISKNNIVVKDAYEDLIKTLMNPEFSEGTEVQIVWDKDNQFTRPEWKGNINNEAFKLVYKGITISYLPTEATTLKEIQEYKTGRKGLSEQERSNMIDKLQLELPHTLALRKQLELSDKEFTTKLLIKGNGTIISRGIDKSSLRSVKGKYEDFYALDPESFLDANKLLSIQDRKTSFSSVNRLGRYVQGNFIPNQGKIYGKQIDANGNPFPVPLFVSKVNLVQAKEIQSNIVELLELLNQGKNTENQEVIKLKDSIAKYIKVDKFSNYNREIGFRVIPQGKNKDGELTEAKIEMSFISDGIKTKGKKLLAVLRTSQNGSGSYLGIFDSEKKIHQTTLEDTQFLDILQRKYQNIDFYKLTENKSFEYNGKNYPTYKDYLIEEEVIQTDIADVVNKKGEVLTNLFGFDNDFTIAISPVLKGKEVETIFKSVTYEKELSEKETTSLDLEYRKNYSLYGKAIGYKQSGRDILSDILKNPLNDNIKDVATFLQSNISKIDLQFSIAELPMDQAASYSTGSNIIRVNTRKKFSEVYFQQTILHETLHGLTVNQLLNSLDYSPEVFAKLTKIDYIDITDIPFKSNANKASKQFMLDIVNLRNSTISQLTKKYGVTLDKLVENTNTFYGLENPFEFISEAMTNPNFRNELRSLENGNNILTNLYNRIIDFLNSVFGTNISKVEDNNLKTAVNLIKNFIDGGNIESFTEDLKVVNYSKSTDKFDNQFTRTEIVETVNTFEGMILGLVRNNQYEIKDNELVDNKDIKDKLRKQFDNYIETCPESCLDKSKKVLNSFNEFFNAAYYNINKNFKNNSLDLDDIEENDEAEKYWNDTAAFSISSQDSVTNQIKMFIKSIPQLNSTEVSYDKDGNALWDTKTTSTGLISYVDFNTVYPYIARNIIGARTMADIIKRLENMSKSNPSFSYIANELKNDANLLAQIESTMAKKYVYDSYVTFIKNIEGNKDIWTTSELKKTVYYQLIADSWVEKVNSKIDELKDNKAKLEFNIKINSTYLKISKHSEHFEDHIEELSNNIEELGNLLGIDLSNKAIKSRLESIRSWNDLEIVKSLQSISKSIIDGKKNDDYGRLNVLGKLEALFRYDTVENSALGLKGKSLYAIRNLNFISDWFSLAKSDTKEGRQEFEELLLNLAKVPELQFSNWLWNNKNNRGFLNYEIIDSKKVPTIKDTVDWDFVKNFNFHPFGGAKEVISKNTQSYTEFGDNDYKLINLIQYIKPNDKTERTKDKEADWVLIPGIIPSDSSSLNLFEVHKIKLGSKELIKDKNSKGLITNLKIDTNSNLFNSMLNINRQEVRRIQQATNQIFDIIDNKLVVKENLDTSILQQSYHYDKELLYKEDGTIDLNKSLLDDKGFPIGKVFNFSSMSIKQGNKLITLDDIGGVKLNGHLGLGEVSSDVIVKIKDFTEKFCNEQINQGYKDYKSLETEVAEKHTNISDGTYENLVAEYILNTFIHNTEQFNFFNGHFSEYKNEVDTNKRAKQVQAPIIGLSVESMKIKYENGNYSDGKTFKGVTIKDYKTKSNSIEFITNSVKERLIVEKGKIYSKSEISNFSLQGESKFDKDVADIVSGYMSINAGDAQGYITLDRLEQIIRGRGIFDKKMEEVFDKARKGKSLNSEDIKTFQSLKPFYYNRNYDAKTNRLIANQIKYSSMILFPQLVKGTELEKLMDYMNDNNIEEVFFESAHKVGAKTIYKIHNKDGTINKDILKSIEPTTYYNSSYGIQLDTPEHLLDADNLLATQIAKIIVGNINPIGDYNVNGKIYKGSKLIKHYFNIQDINISESANDLLKELNIERDGDNFIVNDKDIQNILLEEVRRKGLSDNYSFAIELENNKFKLPLFVNGVAVKWEAILTSIFTNRITKQKMPGGSAVLGSRLFLDNNVTQSETNIEGIQWSKDKLEDKTLRSYKSNDELIVEVLLSSWSSELFKEGQRISIDEISDEVKTMIGYRIPTTSKSYMTVFKVVGFLPEQNRGLVITPDDMVVQMGQDFDIDKWFLINKNFYRNDEDKFIVPKLGKEEKEFNDLLKERKDLLDLLKIENDQKSTPEGKLIGDIFNEDLLQSSNEESKLVNKRLKSINTRLREITIYDKESQLTSWKEEGSKQARQNEIFDIYKSVLTSPDHIKELITPSGYPNIDRIATKMDKIYKRIDKNISIASESVQRMFRKRNVIGKSLVGIAANLNAFGIISQVSKMELNTKNAFKFKYNLDKYNLQDLIERYDEDIEVVDNYAIITHKGLGFSPNGSFQNVDGDLILERASEGVVAFVDNAKDPKAEKLNLTPYTYPTYHTAILSGVNHETMGMFINQPIIRYLNDYYFDTKSLLGNTSGKEVETIKRFYQTQLYLELVKQKKVTVDQKTQKTLDKRDKDKAGNSLDKKYLIFVDRGDTKDLLGYDPDILEAFSSEDLENQLRLNVEGFASMDGDTKLSYLRNQLQILEHFNNWKKSGEGVNDLLRATKTDSIGAGPSMDITTNLIRLINRLRFNDRITINGVPAIRYIYPSHFENEVIDRKEDAMEIASYQSKGWSVDSESSYKPLESYLNHTNKLSVAILSKFFINQSSSFKNVLTTINSLIKRNLKEDELKFVNKYLNINVLQDFNKFKNLDRKNILGIDIKINNNIDLDIDTFKSLSTANKVYIMKERQKYFLRENSQHILNFVTPLLNEAKIKDNKYHKIDFTFYKNEVTDDNLVDSIINMYQSGNEFEKELSKSLIEYSFITNGLSFGLESFRKVIPNEILHELGLGTYLEDKHKLLNMVDGFDYKTIDQFFKNNWNNTQIVPIVRNRWDYLSGETINLIKDNLSKGVSKTEIGKYFNISEESITKISKGNTKIIRTDRENNKRTKDNSPHWNSESTILMIEDKKLKTLSDDVVNAPYLTIPTKDGSILYKKYIKTEIIDEKEISKSIFNGNIYYYRVNKLGKDGVYEFSYKSMFEENNIEAIETVLVSQIENIVEKIEEQRIKTLKSNSLDFPIKNLFSVTPIQSADAKAITKASIATKYIGFGDNVQGSSTQHYRNQAGKYANTKSYNSKDVIFLSVPGKRGSDSIWLENIRKTKAELDIALNSGSTIITDNKDYIESSNYNIGEKEIAKYLSDKATYSEVIINDQKLGVWQSNTNKEQLDLFNTSEQKQEEIKKDCNYGN